MVLSPAAATAIHRLPATPSTVHWGYFDPRLEPALTVAPGDLVAIEALTHHAGGAPDLLMDAGIVPLIDHLRDGEIDGDGHERVCFPRWSTVSA